MCKIAVIPGLTDNNTELAWKFIRKMAKEMSGYSDDDGFGYAAIDGDGKLFGERWFNPKEAFLNRDEKAIIAEQTIKKYKGFVKGKVSVYNSFGVVHDKSLRSVMLHARNATTEKSLINTHPFVLDGTALIHNGVIANHDMLTKKVSTCDSEVILTEYLKQKVADNIKNINGVAGRLDGYYACGVLGKQKSGKLILDIFKETTARLRGFFIKELNTMVFTTPGANDYHGPIQTVCRDMGLTIVEEFELEDSRILRLDALTGEVMDCQEFDSTFRDKTVKKKEHKGGTGGGTGTGGSHSRGNHSHSGIGPFNTFLNGDQTSQRSFHEKQQDDELERELLDGSLFRKGTELNDDLPALPEGSSTSKYNMDEDFEEDENGIWRRKSKSSAV